MTLVCRRSGVSSQHSCEAWYNLDPVNICPDAHFFADANGQDASTMCCYCKKLAKHLPLMSSTLTLVCRRSGVSKQQRAWQVPLVQWTRNVTMLAALVVAVHQHHVPEQETVLLELAVDRTAPIVHFKIRFPLMENCRRVPEH
jgi:hypothetical protein